MVWPEGGVSTYSARGRHARHCHVEMLLNKVESTEVRETAWGRLLGYGAIVVVGSGGSTEPFHEIAHPLLFRSRLQQQIEHTPPLIEERFVAQSSVG